MPAALPEVENDVGVGAARRDEGVGGGEVVVARHGLGVDGEHDHFDTFGQPFELTGEPGVDGDEERRQDGFDRSSVAVRRVVQRAAQQHEDALGPLGDGPPDGHVVHDTTVDEGLAVDLDGWEERGQRRRGLNALGGRSFGEPLHAAVGEGGGHHLQGDRAVFEALEDEAGLDDTRGCRRWGAPTRAAGRSATGSGTDPGGTRPRA